jgi:NAD(P)-dependent dehydrogenase (short-subunit alcohol dehydrogenase family)
VERQRIFQNNRLSQSFYNEKKMKKNYLVIGGSSGIGEAIAERMAKLGNVFVTYHKHPKDSSDSLQYVAYDATGDDQLSLDIDRLDGLVYCPGTINLKPFHRLKAEDFLEDFEINVMGAVKSIQDMLPLLKKSENASVVMFSTIAVQQGMGFHSSVAASKGAIEGFARALAAELAPKIRVNVVAPSIVNTPLADRLLNTDDKVKASEKRHPLQKIGTADDIAAMAQLLLSDESSWITGQIMHVDGGMSAIKLF